MERKTLENILYDEGYRLVENAWDEHGRRTYLHDDEVTRGHLADLTKVFGPRGWSKHTKVLRAFLNEATREIIELEPGGAETDGHLLHHMKAE